MREVMNGLMHVLSTGCQWRAIPKDLPPNGTVYGYFDLWIYGGTLNRIHHALTSTVAKLWAAQPARPPP
jgi:transposase